MTAPLTAGEPLASPPGDPRRREPPAAKPAAKPRRRFRWLRRLFGTLTALVVLVGAGGAVALYSAYARFSADLPDLEGLRHYQPRVMSRVYAGDSRLLAELATERRI